MASLFDRTKDRDDIGEIFRLMNDNCPAPSSTSKKLWKLRWATDIEPHNVSGEKILEKAVAMLARNGHMPGWFNQCPAASGIGDSSRYRQSSVDLVHWGEADGRARLVELKWRRDGPSAAVRQVLRYGAAYVFCRVHRKHLNVDSRPIMNARQVLLQVVAPARYCTEPGLLDCLSRAREGLKRFEIGSEMEELSMSLDVLAFPDWFDRLPYSDGAEVRAGCDRKELTDTGREIREAFDNLTSVHPESGGRREPPVLKAWLDGRHPCKTVQEQATTGRQATPPPEPSKKPNAPSATARKECSFRPRAFRSCSKVQPAEMAAFGQASCRRWQPPVSDSEPAGHLSFPDVDAAVSGNSP